MIPLEDNFTDVLGKALRGQKLSVHAAAARAGLETATVTRLITGHFEERPDPIFGCRAEAQWRCARAPRIRGIRA